MNLPNLGTMRIAVDMNIPKAAEALQGMGEVRFFEGRSLTRADLLEVDVLWVRSVTKVNRELLEGTPVRFVGTATAGVNHIDADYLQEAGIHWVSAPGSNAISVADYLCSALAILRSKGKLEGKKKAAVLGYGHVGHAVVPRLQALGFETKVYDPLRQELYPEEDLCALEELFDADLLTVHIPLTYKGEHATHAWIDRAFLQKFKAGLIFVNAARGEVMKQAEVLELSQEGFLSALVLDVFEREPEIPLELLEAADLATPHIAGYSWTGKIRGTQMLRQSLRDWLNLAEDGFVLPTQGSTLCAQDEWELILQAYDLREDDARLRSAVAEAGNAAAVFDGLRKNYPVRLEFSDYQVQMPKAVDLKALGFVP